MRIFAIVAGLVLVLLGQSNALAVPTQTPTAAFCTPPNFFTNGQTNNAPPVYADLQHAETCSGQPGDLYSDGPLYPATFTFSGSSLSVTFPTMTWYVAGNRIFTGSAVEAIPASQTTYWFLDALTDAFVSETSNSPPTSTSKLEYVITASGSGVTAVTFPTQAIYTPFSITTQGSNVSACFICIGTAGSATGPSIKMANATGGSTYTSFGAPNNGTVQSVQNSVLNIASGGTNLVAVDASGDVGILGALSVGTLNVGALDFSGTSNFSAANPFDFTSTVGIDFQNQTTGPFVGWIFNLGNPTRATTDIVDWQLFGSNVFQVLNDGSLLTQGSLESANQNAFQGQNTMGSIFQSAAMGSAPAYTFNGNGVLFTGDIADFQLNGTTETSIANTGAFTAPSITDSALASGDCVQATTGGRLISAAAACGTGGGGAGLGANTFTGTQTISNAAPLIFTSTSANVLLSDTASGAGFAFNSISTGHIANFQASGTTEAFVDVTGNVDAPIFTDTGLTNAMCVHTGTGAGGLLSSTTSDCPVLGANSWGGAQTYTTASPINFTATNPTIASSTASGVAFTFNASGPTSGNIAAFDSGGSAVFTVGTAGALAAPSATFSASTGLVFSNTGGTTITSASTGATAFNFNATSVAATPLTQFESNSVVKFSIAGTGLVKAVGGVQAGSGTGPTLTAGDLGASRGVSSGAVNIGGSTSACLVDYGVTTASVISQNCEHDTVGVAKSSSNGAAIGVNAPFYGASGATAPTTSHCNSATFTAGSTTQTVTLTGASVFGTYITSVNVVDSTSAIPLPSTAVTATSASGFTVATTSTHVYYYTVCGY